MGRVRFYTATLIVSNRAAVDDGRCGDVDEPISSILLYYTVIDPEGCPIISTLDSDAVAGIVIDG